MLLAVAKVTLPAGGGEAVAELAFTLDDVHVPGASRQPLPGLLKLWAGDAGLCEGCPAATLQLARGAHTCAAGAAAAGRDEL